MRKMPILALLFVMLAACGGGTDEPADTAADPTAAATDDPGTGSPQKQLTVADSKMGKILTVDGTTVYIFTSDTANKSTCTAGCAQTWPPLEVGDGVGYGAGVDRAKAGTTTRDDGKEQVTYASQPLYTFSGDTKPGDTNGQGVGGKWYMVGPDGKPHKT